MKEISIDHPRLHQLLKDAYRDRAECALPQGGLGESFNIAVMREVRKTAFAAAPSPFAWFQKTAWRLAPVACGIIFALTAFLMQFDPTFEYDMAALSLSDPIGFQETNLFSF
jgi:hypothetical protein